MVLLRDLLEITPHEYVLINDTNNPDDIKCIYEGYFATNDDVCTAMISEYLSYEVVDQEAFYDDEDDIVGIEIDIIKTENIKPQMILKDLLSMIDSESIDIYDDVKFIKDGSRDCLLRELSNDVLSAEVSEINVHCNSHWFEIDIKGDFENEK